MIVISSYGSSELVLCLWAQKAFLSVLTKGCNSSGLTEQDASLSSSTAADGRLSTFGSSIGASLRGWSRLSGGCGGPLTGNTAFLLVFKRTGDSGRILLEVTAAGKLRVLV